MPEITETLLELPSANSSDKDRQFIMALARGLELLRAFSPGEGPLGNKELSERTGIPKPTVSRMTYTLSKLGYLEYITRLEKYQLGVAVLSSGYSYLQNLDMRNTAHPLMQALAEEFEVSVALAARDRLSMTYIDIAQGSGLAAPRLDIGSRLSVESSAIGMAFVYALPALEQDYLVTALKERCHDTKALKEFEDRLARTKSELSSLGFCVVFGSVDPNVIAAGTPCFASNGAPSLALNISATRYQYDVDFFYNSLGPRLQQLSSELNRQMPDRHRW